MRFFKKNSGQQQTDGIVNNCWRGFVTEPKTMGASLDKKEK